MPTHSLKIAAVTLALLGGVTLPSVYTDVVTRNALETFLSGNGSFSVAKADIRRDAGSVTLHDVATKVGSARVSIGALTLPFDAPRFDIIGAARAQTAASASATDVKITSGEVTYTIKKIDLSGTTLSNADLAAILDPKSSESATARLKKLNAKSITIPEVIIETASPTAPQKTTISQVQVDFVADGKIGTANAAGSMTTINKPDDPSVINTGAIQAKGIDLIAATRFSNTVRTDEAEPLQTISDSVSISNISLSGKPGEGGMTIGSLTETAFKARPLKIDIHALDKKADTPRDKIAQDAQMKAVLDDLASSVAFGGFGLDKIAFDIKEKSGSTTKLDLAKIEVRDFRDRTLGAFAMRDLNVATSGSTITVATVDVGGVVIPPMKPAADTIAPPSIRDNLPKAAKADATLIDVNINSPKEDGTTSNVKFKIAHVGSEGDATPGRLPAQGKVFVDNLTFDLPDGKTEGAKELYAMGYRAMKLSLAADSAYDQAKQTLSIRKFMITGADMGTIDLGIDLANVSEGVMSGDPAIVKASAMAMLLKRVDFHVANSGLFDKAIAWKADQDGKTVDQERAEGVDFFADKLPMALGNGPNIQAVGSAVAKFIADPKTLHISAASKEGLGVADMGLIGSPDELLSRLDIQAEANK